jgi:hypothetical protein
MKTHFRLLLAVITLRSITCLGNQPTQFVIAADYPKTGAILINGRKISDEAVLNELAKTIHGEGAAAPIVVVLPQSFRFEDWNNVRGLMDKVGFTNVRYFVKWTSTQKMIELKQVGEAVESF